MSLRVEWKSLHTLNEKVGLMSGWIHWLHSAIHSFWMDFRDQNSRFTKTFETMSKSLFSPNFSQEITKSYSCRFFVNDKNICFAVIKNNIFEDSSRLHLEQMLVKNSGHFTIYGLRWSWNSEYPFQFYSLRLLHSVIHVFVPCLRLDFPWGWNPLVLI